MTRRLLLMRHAKSDWGAAYGDDHERPLAKRGRKAARAVGRFLAEAGRQPDAIVTSSARRARTTVELAAEAGGWPAPIAVTDELYGSGPSQVLDVARRDGGGAQTLLLAGHEPTWSSLTSRLTGGGHVRFPTAAVACVRFEIEDWADLPPEGVLEWFLIPRLLVQGKAG